MDNTKRFSNRVENYVKYRPSYPAPLIDFLSGRIGISPVSDAAIADIGSGTGIFTKLLLDLGRPVYAVEPNREMREAAERSLGGRKNFISVAAPAEDTGLESESVDLIVSASAFHWFDLPKARLEFSRILRPGGHVALVWNKRAKEGGDFIADYNKFLDEHARDGGKTIHEKLGEKELTLFFGGAFETLFFPNRQILTGFDALEGRVLSSSGAPLPGDPRYGDMAEALRELYRRHAKNGVIEIEYRTTLYFGKLTIFAGKLETHLKNISIEAPSQSDDASPNKPLGVIVINRSGAI